MKLKLNWSSAAVLMTSAAAIAAVVIFAPEGQLMAVVGALTTVASALAPALLARSNDNAR